jgi:hypothetical protein
MEARWAMCYFWFGLVNPPRAGWLGCLLHLRRLFKYEGQVGDVLPLVWLGEHHPGLAGLAVSSTA